MPSAAEITEGPSSGLRSAVLWSYALTVGRVGTTVVVMFLLARLLGPAEFGIIALALLVVNLAQIPIEQGMVSALVQREHLTNDHLNATFATLTLGSLGVGALVAAFGPVWAALTREPQLTQVCLALALLVPVTAAMVVPEALLRRALRFRIIAIRTLLGSLIGGAAGIALALAGAGVWALVVQQLAVGVVGLVVVWLSCRWRPNRPVRLRAMRDLLPFASHATHGGLATMLCSRADQLIAGLLFGTVTVGIYRLALRLPEMLVDVTSRSLQQVALPALSRLQQDRAAFAARLADLQHLGAVAGLPTLGVLIAAAEPLIELLGPQWDGTALPLQLLCLYAAANVYGVLLGPALNAIGHPGRLAAIAWSQGTASVVLFVAVGLMMTGSAPGSQAAAIAIAAACLQAVVSAVAVQVTRRTVSQVKIRLLAPTVPAVAALVAAAAAPYLLAGLVDGPDRPLLQLIVNCAVACLAAAAVLLTTDRRLRALLRTQLHRGRRR